VTMSIGRGLVWLAHGAVPLCPRQSNIDMSQPFRFTGIPNNATLDLVESVSRVTACSRSRCWIWVII
jgi:hypothetical protein